MTDLLLRIREPLPIEDGRIKASEYRHGMCFSREYEVKNITNITNEIELCSFYEVECKPIYERVLARKYD